MEVTVQEIEKKLEKLPKEYLSQVNDYINFLKEKKFQVENIPEWQIYEVQKRKKQLLDHPENIFSEEEMEKFLNQLKK